MPPGRAGHAGSHGETPGSVRRQRGTHGKKLYSGFYGASLVVQTVEYAYNAGDPASIPGSRRYPGERQSEQA